MKVFLKFSILLFFLSVVILVYTLDLSRFKGKVDLEGLVTYVSSSPSLARSTKVVESPTIPRPTYNRAHRLSTEYVSTKPSYQLLFTRLSCCSIAAQMKIKDLCPKDQKVKLSISATCSCKDYMLCKLVMVTAISSNHFNESKAYFGSIHVHFPRTKIIVYDLGLTESQSRTVASYCNTEVRKFNFSKYPYYTKDLVKFAWKPFIVNEMSEEYEIFLYCDASCRIGKLIKNMLPYLLIFPLIPCSRLPPYYQVMKTTHDGMLKYLKINTSRKELASFHPTFQAGAVIYWANDFIKKQFLPKWVDCAMHIECLSPKGARNGGCNLTKPKHLYAGCHRFDQSAFNAILIRDYSDSIKSFFQKGGEIPNLCRIRIRRAPAKNVKLCINS